MKKLLALPIFLLLLFLNVAVAQNEVRVFDSYEDYIAGNSSAVYKELTSYSPNKSIGKAEGLFEPILQIRNAEGKKENISIQNKWGFVYRDILFRNSEARMQGKALSNPENLYFALWGKIGDSLLVWINAINAFEDELKVFNVGRSTTISYGDYFHYNTSINGDFHFEDELTTDFKSHQNQINTALQCFYDKSKMPLKSIFKNKKTGVVDYEKFYLKVNKQFGYTHNKVLFECIDK